MPTYLRQSLSSTFGTCTLYLNFVFKSYRGKMETSDVTAPAVSAKERVAGKCSQASDWVRRQVRHYMPNDAEEARKTSRKSG